MFFQKKGIPRSRSTAAWSVTELYRHWDELLYLWKSAKLTEILHDSRNVGLTPETRMRSVEPSFELRLILSNQLLHQSIAAVHLFLAEHLSRVVQGIGDPLESGIRAEG